MLDNERGFVTETSLSEEVVRLRFEMETLEESWDAAAQTMQRMRAEDEGWNIFGQAGGNHEEGFSKPVLEKIALKAQVQAVGNPLLKNGFDLRFNPIFSRGFKIEGDLKPRYERKLNKESIQDLLFTAAGHDQLERSCYLQGNLFFAYNTQTGEGMLLPFKEVVRRAVDPDMPSRTAYYLWVRSRTDFDGKVTNLEEWIPVVEWKTSGKDTEEEIANHPVNHDWTIVDMRVNVPVGGHWGVPDIFPALGPAWGYSEYIRDAASLLKALNQIAWKVVGKTPKQAQTAGVSLASMRRAGNTAAMTAGTDLAAMPKAGQVDMTDGTMLAAMVASSLGINTDALLAKMSGTSAAAVVGLDGPTVAMARARQQKWVRFYNRVFAAMGIEGLSINFPKITEDPIHRQVSSLATGRATGAIWADEYRAAFLEAMSIEALHDDAPDVDEYAQAQNALGYLNAQKTEAEADPLARQGNSGVAGSLGEIDNTNRNQDTAAGNGSQTDLVG